MYYAVGTQSMNPNYYGRGRKLEQTDGIFPTETMRLHRRIIDWHRKRRIPVKGTPDPTTLSSYLIDPKFLKEKTKSKDIPVTHIPSNIPVYQYSQITYDAPRVEYVDSGPLSIAMQGVGHMLGTVSTALGAELYARYYSLITPHSATHYGVERGASPLWRQRLKMFSAAILSGGLLIAALTLDGGKSVKPSPVSANSDPTASSQTEAGTNTDSSRSRTVTDPSNKSQATAPMPYASSAHSTQSTVGVTQNSSPGAPVTSSNTPIGETTPSTVITPPVVIEPIPSNPITEPLSPVLEPVTDVVNDVLATQITVNVPLTGGDSNQPLIELSQ
jgi:hypothetical protein